MRYEEIREAVRVHFEQALIKHRASVAATGPLPSDRLLSCRTSAEHINQQIIDGVIDDEQGHHADLSRFMATNDLSLREGSTEYAQLSREYLKGHRDWLLAIVQHSTSLQQFDFDSPQGQAGALRSNAKSVTPLGDMADGFFKDGDLEARWTEKTRGEREEHLKLLYEIVPVSADPFTVDAAIARKVKDVLRRYPTNRHKSAATRGKSLEEVLSMDGLKVLDIRTINKYLQTYASLFRWAKRHGYVAENPFDGLAMRTAKAKLGNERVGFTADELAKIASALRDPTTGPQQHLWGALIAMHTGARLNEVAQLFLSDIRQIDDIWCFDINANGPGKRLKNAQSARIVPVHPWLIAHGLLSYAENKRARRVERLFPEYPYTKSDGFGRNLGRWFNEKLLVDLSIKRDDVSFHSLRHSVQQQLSGATVPLPYVQAILGHEQGNTTLDTYNRSGFPPRLLLAAIQNLLPLD